MHVLGIETSCDETAAAVVLDGTHVRSNEVFSQVALHQPYGGVVPEIASRNHVTYLPGVLEDAVSHSGLNWNQLDAVAVTYGPGLASSLLVGIASAKALALRIKVPLIGINHLEAHIYSAFLSHDSLAFSDVCPFIALVVSGGHTCLVRVDGLGHYRLLGTTMDDAAGEAFDKGANLLGLGYPGGPAIDSVSRGADPDAIHFPRSRMRKPGITGGLQHDLCFSFSGLKTALMYYMKTHFRDQMAKPAFPPEYLANIAASYQEAIVDTLIDRVRLAINREKVRSFSAVGGVSFNHRLREKLANLAESTSTHVFLPLQKYCVDNAAMVGGLAGKGQGVSGRSVWSLDACPNLEIGR